jgi:transcriptional regulator with XRE-family HTH domain
MPSKLKYVSEIIREAIEKTGTSRYRIAAETGITQAALSRFMAGKRGLSMTAIDALAAYFDLELVPRDSSRVVAMKVVTKKPKGKPGSPMVVIPVVTLDSQNAPPEQAKTVSIKVASRKEKKKRPRSIKLKVIHPAR